MNKFTGVIEGRISAAMKQLGLDETYSRVVLSNRPDLCEYQCNGCLAAAKLLKKKPIEIAAQVTELLKDSTEFESIEAAAPGFINIKLSPLALSSFLKDMGSADRFGINTEHTKHILVDYGGANVAKPLHIGHLRSAIIGESIKRMGAYMGNRMTGDVHLGDWGLQMGLIIEELRLEKPDLVYYDESWHGEYPSEAPFTIDELEKIYPKASARAKEDEEFKQKAHEATAKLQSGYAPFNALWRHIMKVSLADLKKNYDRLDVHFELWKGESDVQYLIPGLISQLEESGIAYESEGALVVDVAEPSDKTEIPPCIIRKSDGAALYATSDLATLVEREREICPDAYIYITDKRQALHFTQFFRVARMDGIVPAEHSLTHIGFGTMNGKDGKPFKTRAGGVMRLEELLTDTEEAVYRKILENKDIEEEEARQTAKTVALAAIKYGDLSNQASKDYIFDLERFTSFEGNTGPYILYTIVRIKSILNRYMAEGGEALSCMDILPCITVQEKDLDLELVKFNEMIESAWNELAPHKVCQYIYGVAEAFNSFYHEVRILSEPDAERKRSYLARLKLTRDVLTACTGMLGIPVPDRM